MDNLLSIVSTSFENRFSTLPTGVTSKNAMGHFKMLDREIACRMRAASSDPMKIVTDVRRTIITAKHSNDLPGLLQ